MVLVVLVVLWFSGSCVSRGSLVLMVLWFSWFFGSRRSTVLVLVLCVWLPCSTHTQIFSDGTTCGNLGVRDGMRAKSERMELGDELDMKN